MADKFINLVGNVVELTPEQAQNAGTLGYIKASPEQVAQRAGCTI